MKKLIGDYYRNQQNKNANKKKNVKNKKKNCSASKLTNLQAMAELGCRNSLNWYNESGHSQEWLEFN